MKKEILIVGAGLAGISVAMQFIQNHWRLDEFLPFAENFSNQITLNTAIPIYHPITIRRMFSSAHEKTMWLEKQNLEKFNSYLEPLTIEDDHYKLAKNEFGSGRIKGSSFVNPIPFLKASKQWISEHGTIIYENADYSDFNPEESTYKGKKYDEIVFCEGSNNDLNPWFGYLPVEHTKGEVLTISSEKITENESLNRKCFLLPVGNKTFKLGATYVWHTNNTVLTEEGKNDLIEKAGLLTSFPFEITEHKAGIRPTSPDRRPIVGRHHIFKKFSIFNGLGTKGYLIAPKLAEEFVHFILYDTEMDKEVKLERFDKLRNLQEKK
ncbi:MAG: FAD-dependent oxidoreductase [Flavobacteriia bacterium]|nr:FAD-dependent oxidoreductase [Flavobacteriia bacterium]